MSKIVSAVIPKDSGRRMTVYLSPRSRNPTVLEAHIIEDFNSRMAWKSQRSTRVYTRPELEAKDIEWVTDAVQMGFGTFGVNRPILDRDCFAVKNGGPGSVMLKELTVDEIDMIEVHHSGPISAPVGTQGAPIRSSRRGSMPRITLPNTLEAGLANRGKNCTTVYVWLR